MLLQFAITEKQLNILHRHFVFKLFKLFSTCLCQGVSLEHCVRRGNTSILPVQQDDQDPWFRELLWASATGTGEHTGWIGWINPLQAMLGSLVRSYDYSPAKRGSVAFHRGREYPLQFVQCRDESCFMECRVMEVLYLLPMPMSRSFLCAHSFHPTTHAH